MNRHTALALAILASFAAAQEPARNPQRVAFLGEPGAARTKAYTDFLQQRFAAVTTFDRDDADLAKVRKADVVLLDWGQSDAARKQRAARWSPLGKRDAWDRPTVLLGSAGLNLAGAWQVRGSFG
jgi:hypothetical protein